LHRRRHGPQPQCPFGLVVFDGLLAALQGEQVDSPKPSGVSCPYCRGESLEDVELGWRCCNCKRLGWIWLPGGSIVRADCEHMDLEWN
jgi:hypothetical protein